MLTDELLRRVASQSEVRETRRVQVWGDTLRAAVSSGELRTLDKILEHPNQTSQSKTFRYGHIAGAPRTAADLQNWQAQFPLHPLPADLAEFLLQVDGLHLWADLDQGRAYFGIAPLDEWHNAVSDDGPRLFFEPRVGMLTISYHQNGDYSLVLDTSASLYLWFDHEDIENPTVIGATLGELLDWIWTRADERRPMAIPAG